MRLLIDYLQKKKAMQTCRKTCNAPFFLFVMMDGRGLISNTYYILDIFFPEAVKYVPETFIGG